MYLTKKHNVFLREGVSWSNLVPCVSCMCFDGWQMIHLTTWISNVLANDREPQHSLHLDNTWRRQSSVLQQVRRRTCTRRTLRSRSGRAGRTAGSACRTPGRRAARSGAPAARARGSAPGPPPPRARAGSRRRSRARRAPPAPVCNEMTSHLKIS